MQSLPHEVMERVLDVARSNGCEAERIKIFWSTKDFNRDFLLMGKTARIFVRTKSHNSHNRVDEHFATQLNASKASWEALSHVIIVFEKDIYVLPAEFVAKRASASGSFFFNSRMGGVSEFKSPDRFKRLSQKNAPLSLWEAILRTQKNQPTRIVALESPPILQKFDICSRFGCKKLLEQPIYDEWLRISCCSISCMVMERKTRR